MKELYMELESLILEYRSLAENNPSNILSLENDTVKTYVKIFGTENFSSIVNEILDRNE